MDVDRGGDAVGKKANELVESTAEEDDMSREVPSGQACPSQTEQQSRNDNALDLTPATTISLPPIHGGTHGNSLECSTGKPSEKHRGGKDIRPEMVSIPTYPSVAAPELTDGSTPAARDPIDGYSTDSAESPSDCAPVLSRIDAAIAPPQENAESCEVVTPSEISNVDGTDLPEREPEIALGESPPAGSHGEGPPSGSISSSPPRQTASLTSPASPPVPPVAGPPQPSSAVSSATPLLCPTSPLSPLSTAEFLDRLPASPSAQPVSSVLLESSPGLPAVSSFPTIALSSSPATCAAERAGSITPSVERTLPSLSRRAAETETPESGG